jgi:hypothetical protein
MANDFATKPVEDSVSRVNDEIAVGEDLAFQRKWWRFESAAWVVFTLIIIFDLAGLFGRGPLANAERRSPDATIDVKYERIERMGTPSMLTIQLAQGTIHDRQVKLYVSQSLVKELGTQRIIPQPGDTSVGDAGLTYTFSASAPPATIEMALQPPGPGLYAFTVGVVGGSPVRARVFVFP